MTIKQKVSPFLFLSILLLSLQVSTNAMDDVGGGKMNSPVSQKLTLPDNRAATKEASFTKGNVHAAYTLGTIYRDGTDGIKEDENRAAHWFKVFAEAPYRPKQDVIWVLSIDGGGIRGLIPVTILEMLEKELSIKFELDIYIADFVRLVAGTSTGSLIALGLTVSDPSDLYKPLYHAENLSSFYTQEGVKIFPPTYWVTEIWSELKQISQPKFSPEELKESLRRHFKDINFGATINGIQALIPTYQLQTDRLYIFDNKKASDSNYMMREIVQASTAAPTYFPAVSIGEEDYVDGGIGLNNPSFKAYQQARLSHPQQKIILVSLGTGITRQPLPDYLREGGALDSIEGKVISSVASALGHRSSSVKELPKLHKGWVAYAPNIMMREAGENIDEFLDFMQIQDSHFEYFRLQPEIHKVEMDDTKEIPYLRQIAEKFYKSSEKVKELRERLEKLYSYQVKVLEKKISLVNQVNILNLQGIRLNLSHIQLLCQGLALSSTLTDLNLQRTGLTSESLQKLCHALTHNNKVTNLNLAENGIGNVGVRFLAKLLNINTTILILNLSCNGIKASSADVLKYLLRQKTPREKLPSLKDLEKDRFLTFSFPTSLIELDLSANKVGPQGLQNLIQDLEELREFENLPPLKKLSVLKNTWKSTDDSEADSFNTAQFELIELSKSLNFNVEF